MSTLYYYTDSENRPQGPYTLEELIDFRRKSIIGNTTYVVEVGSQSWQSFSSLLPFPEVLPPPQSPLIAPTAVPASASSDDYACPKCATSISNAAKACPACKFPVADFKENQKLVKFTKMEQIPYSEIDLEATLLQVYRGKSGGCAAIVLLVLGTILLIIPIIGWIVAPICWGLGFFVLLAPVRGLRYVEKIMNHEEYQKSVQSAKIRLHNRFRNVACPKCNHKELEITWQDEGGFWDCPGCQKKLLREREYLFFLPKPEAVPNNNMIESFVGGYGELPEQQSALSTTLGAQIPPPLPLSVAPTSNQSSPTDSNLLKQAFASFNKRVKEKMELNQQAKLQNKSRNK